MKPLDMAQRKFALKWHHVVLVEPLKLVLGDINSVAPFIAVNEHSESNPNYFDSYLHELWVQTVCPLSRICFCTAMRESSC